MASSYLVKKADIYYFRHYIPIQVQQIFGKKEFLKTLKVTQKSLAIKLSREIKIVFDTIMEKSQHMPSLTWKEIRDAVDSAFEIIYQKYVTNVDTYGPSYRDGYDPLNYIPPEYQEHVLLRDDSLEWGNVGEISALADKIAQWANLNAVKGSREHHLLCYYTILGLYEHAHRKEHPAHYKNSILQDINESIKSIGSNFRYPESAEGLEGKQHVNVHKLINIYTTYLAENKNVWADKTRVEYEQIFKNLIFPIIEMVTNKPLDKIYVTDITQNIINSFIEILQLIPAQFTKRFKGKLSLAESIKYARELESDRKVDLDLKTIKHLKEKINATTLNRKYVGNFSALLKHAVIVGALEKNVLEGRWIKDKKNSQSTIRPFDYNELEIIFSNQLFKDKCIDHKQNEYDGQIPYFKFWMPLLGVYTGARENELAQMRLTDLCIDVEIPYLCVKESSETRVKTKSSIRNVPIHPTLIDLGFLKYIEWLKKNDKKYLFPELENRENKGGVVSKWFSYFLKNNCKIVNNIDNTIIGFHSFRNNFSDEYKQKGAEPYIAGETMGHKTQGMTFGVYGSQIKLKPMYENMMKYLTFEGVKFPWATDINFNKNKFPWE